MSSGKQADPDNLNLSAVSEEAWLDSGPLIDSSEEFPLPSLDGELAPGAEGLFPLIPVEATVEEMTPVQRFPDLARASKSVEPVSALEDEFALPSIDDEIMEPPGHAKAASPPKSDDADYFEAGLDEEPAQVVAPPAAPKMRVGVPPSPSTDAHLAKGRPAFQLPPQVGSASLPDLDAALEKVRARDRMTQPGAPQASITAPTPPMVASSPAAAATPPVFAAAPPVVAPASPSAASGGRPPVTNTPAEAQPPQSESSIDEIFFDGEPGTPKEKQDSKKVTRDDWAEAPVDQYVRKAEISRKSSKKKKVRIWIPAAGLAAVALAFAVSKPIFTSMYAVEVSNPVLVVASQPKAEVFDGETSLGKTPLALNAEDAIKKLEIRKPGFEAVAVQSWDPKSADGPIQKFVRPLQVSPVALSWDGLDQSAVIWWNGTKTAPASLAQVQPGKYSLKVKPADRPAVTVPVDVEPRGEESGPLALAELVQAEFAKQPEVKVGLKMPDGKGEAKDLAFTLKSLDEKAPFSASLKISTGTTADLVLPKPGKYKISFPGNGSYKSVSQTVELASGVSENVAVALAKQPPKPVVAKPVSRPAYRPPPAPAYRPPYRPPPRYNGGGGGGGGRIAPPAF